MCSTPHEAGILCDSLLGDRFLVWGWAASPAMAKAVALFHIVDKARNGGVHGFTCTGSAYGSSQPTE